MDEEVENVREDSVDWNEAPLVKWLGTTARAKTKQVYCSAFRTYAKYTGMTATQLVDEALEDAKRDVRERRDVVKARLIGFFKWMKEEYPVHSRGKGEHVILRKGLSDKTAHVYVNAIRSFYTTYEIYVKLKGRARLPRARVTNERMKVGAEQVKVLVDHAHTPRDRAIILTLFQSGMDVKTLCNLKYGDVSKGLAKNEHPLRLDLFREKSGTDYYSFLGHDALEAIKAYIHSAEARGTRFDEKTPLFLKASIKARRREAMTTNLVQNMMRDLAIKAEFVDKDMNGKLFNPLGPHALRESFGSIMTNSGVPDTIVDFWLGHQIGEMAKAYKSVQAESLRRIYLERERLISISMPKVDVAEVEAKIEAKVDERSRQLQTLVNGLTAENMNLRTRLETMELRQEKVRRELDNLRGQVGEDIFKRLSDAMARAKSWDEFKKRFRRLGEGA